MSLLIDLQELYGKARKYLDEEWKKDPETEPYRSKYKAMDYLKQIRENVLDLMSTLEETTNQKYLSQLQGIHAVTLLQMGIISLDTEEMSSGENYLNETLKAVTDDLDPRFILVALAARNHLGILWCQRSEYEIAKDDLESCENLYNSFMSSDLCESAMSLHEHFDSSNECGRSNGCEEIEKVHTLTKFYLAQVYGKLGDSLKSAIYCHETLRRQLESKQYDAVDWALNAATLSQYFMERKLFTQARHHLAAASYMLDQHEDILKSQELPEEEMEAKKEELRHRGADVSRCWAKFGIFLLEQSKESDLEIISDEKLQESWFPSLELAEYENQMSNSLLCDFDSARDVMLVTQKFLVAAKEYYSLENHASDYVQIVQDHSTLIRHLSWFEKDETRLCKMLKKRINMIEDVLKELNPQYYLNVCRALWFELGESYHDLLTIKQNKIREGGGLPNPAALTKANQLSEHSIRNFREFLNSVKDKQSQFPDPLPEDLLRPTLVAHFFLGRLYYKLVSPDKRQVLKNTHEAFSCFKYLVDYCNNHPKGMSAVIDEYHVSEEIMNLLELKIRQSINLIS